MLDGKIDTSFNFSWNNAAHLAWCSAFAYNQPLTGRKLAKESGYKECKFFDKDGAQGYGLATDKYIVIALRGTEPKEKSDVVADLKAWKSSSKYKGRVHAGFKDEVLKIMDQIDKFVAKHEGKKIYVCGHSLGAAMATIVTTRLKNKPEAVYTYGSPRVGNRKFAHHFDKDYTCYRFVNKLWSIIVDENGNLSKKIVDNDEGDKDTLFLHHQTIKKLGEDIEDLHFNTAVSQLMIYCNHLQKCNTVSKKLIEELVIILSPFVPHIAEEFWSLLGQSQTISYHSWPKYSEDLIQLDEVTIAVQVNGKLRANINISKDSNESDVISEAMSLENVKKFTSDGNIVKTIYVPNRLLNFVVQ